MLKIKSVKGITLIALVVTVIVLIILAGVTLNLILGENGLVQKATKGKEDYLKAKYEEDIELTIAEAFTDRDDEENIEKAYIEVVKEKIASKNFDWINGEIIMCDDELEEHQDTETDSVTLNTLLLIPTKDGYEIRVRVENDITKAVVETVEKANYEEFTVTYDANGADSGSVEGQTIRSGFKVKLKSASTLTKAGHSFAGWGESQNADSGSTLQPGSRQTITENKTYYAIWEENTVTITYLPGVETGYTGEMESSTPAKDSTTTLIPNAFQRTGYNFTGWKDETGADIADKATISTNKNYTLTAQWEIIEYTIGYTLNGGTVTNANPTKYTVETDEFILTNPTRAGYTFTGWSGTGLTGNTNKTVKITKGSTGNRTYTANLKENVPTVTLTDGTTLEVTSSNIASKIGTAVNYSQGGGTWRIFYLDKKTSTYPNGKYGDCTEDKPYCLYIKRDYDSSKKINYNDRKNYGTNDTIKQWLRKFNPLWKTNDDNINNANEKISAYICYPNNWTTYCNTSVANYAIGSPSVEMYMDAYNQWGGYTSGKGPLNYKFVNGESGYSVGVNGTYANSGNNTNDKTVVNGPYNIFTNSGVNFWLGSPSRNNYSGFSRLCYIPANKVASTYDADIGICPIVSLK